MTEPQITFDSFGLDAGILRGIRDMRYKTPTPIQAMAIPPILAGRDVLGLAQTGTGKTAAFLLPILHHLIPKPRNETRALILTPTRELAFQIEENVLGMAYHTGIRSVAVYGGVPMEPQERSLRAGVPIVVATPGRLIDLHRYGAWQFSKLEFLVLDEADRMLDMGFLPDIQLIMTKLPPVRQKLLFSATLAPEIMKLAGGLLKDPVHVKVGQTITPDKITQKFYTVPDRDKPRFLVSLLKKAHFTSVIVFTNTKTGAEKLYRRLRDKGISAGVIHGDRDQKHRDQVIVDFKNDVVTVLVATDVAARGLDIEGVSHVINFDLPFDPDAYVHRIGRTARAQAIGDAISFCTHEDNEMLKAIEKRVGISIRLEKPDLPHA